MIQWLLHAKHKVSDKSSKQEIFETGRLCTGVSPEKVCFVLLPPLRKSESHSEQFFFLANVTSQKSLEKNEFALDECLPSIYIEFDQKIIIQIITQHFCVLKLNFDKNYKSVLYSVKQDHTTRKACLIFSLGPLCMITEITIIASRFVGYRFFAWNLPWNSLVGQLNFSIESPK